MERELQIGEFYRHFKGNVYQIREIAKDSETLDKIVVYQGMYPPYECWVRNYENFMAPVDTGKYPNASQKYRFERIMPEELQSDIQKRQIECSLQEDGYKNEQAASVLTNKLQKKEPTEKSLHTEDIKQPANSLKEFSKEELHDIFLEGRAEKFLEDKMSAEEIGTMGMMQLLDAESFHQKREIFKGLKKYLTKNLLMNIAVALDIVLEDGTAEEQYDSILHCLDALEHYEGGRLR